MVLRCRYLRIIYQAMIFTASDIFEKEQHVPGSIAVTIVSGFSGCVFTESFFCQLIVIPNIHDTKEQLPCIG